MYFLAETHRNSRNTPKYPEIAETPRNFTRGGMGGVSYRFTYWYEIFCPFQSERNGIYNIESDTS